MKYKKPNFNEEWKEATRYRELESMGKDKWIEFASKNFDITNYEKIKDVLGNVDLDYENLNPSKKKRFEKSFEEKEIEIPIVIKFSDKDYDLLGGNTRLSGLVKKGINPKLWVVDLSNKGDVNEKWSDKYKKSIDCNNPKGFSQRAHCQGKKKKETKEMTGADSAGAFSGPLMGKVVKKKEIYKIPNFDLNEEEEFKEATDASSMGSYDVPLFGKSPKGNKDPLKISGSNSIYKGRAVKDKKFPRFGGPKGIYVKVKEKCKKFPYCNQGNTGALEFISEDEGIRSAIQTTSKKYGIPLKEVEKLVLNQIKQIFI